MYTPMQDQQQNGLFDAGAHVPVAALSPQQAPPVAMPDAAMSTNALDEADMIIQAALGATVAPTGASTDKSDASRPASNGHVLSQAGASHCTSANDEDLFNLFQTQSDSSMFSDKSGLDGGHLPQSLLGTSDTSLPVDTCSLDWPATQTQPPSGPSDTGENGHGANVRHVLETVNGDDQEHLRPAKRRRSESPPADAASSAQPTAAVPGSTLVPMPAATYMDIPSAPISAGSMSMSVSALDSAQHSAESMEVVEKQPSKSPSSNATLSSQAPATPTSALASVPLATTMAAHVTPIAPTAPVATPTTTVSSLKRSADSMEVDDEQPSKRTREDTPVQPVEQPQLPCPLADQGPDTSNNAASDSVPLGSSDAPAAAIVPQPEQAKPAPSTAAPESAFEPPATLAETSKTAMSDGLTKTSSPSSTLESTATVAESSSSSNMETTQPVETKAVDPEKAEGSPGMKVDEAQKSTTGTEVTKPVSAPNATPAQPTQPPQPTQPTQPAQPAQPAKPAIPQAAVPAPNATAAASTATMPKTAIPAASPAIVQPTPKANGTSTAGVDTGTKQLAAQEATDAAKATLPKKQNVKKPAKAKP